MVHQNAANLLEQPGPGARVRPPTWSRWPTTRSPVANEGVSLNLASNKPDEPVEASPAQTASSNLSDVLAAAPDLKLAPGVAFAVARYGGPVAENAQQVASVADARVARQA